MKTSILTLCFPIWMVLWAEAPASANAAAKEYLTQKEIEQIQDAQELDKRVKLYMDAAALRLKAAEERLYGKESIPGDPLEFFSPEEMIDGYYQIVRSVMLNLDDAFQKPSGDREKLGKALKNLKDTMERAPKSLEILKKMAEEKQQEELWNLINKAIDITVGAREGAELGLSQQPAPPKKKRN